MRKLLFLAAALCLCPASADAQADEEIIIMRGDANHDGVVNNTDGIFIRDYLLFGGDEPPCMNEADANHDGVVTLNDAVYIWDWLFSSGSAPPAPGPYGTECTESTEPVISCYSGCT